MTLATATEEKEHTEQERGRQGGLSNWSSTPIMGEELSVDPEEQIHHDARSGLCVREKKQPSIRVHIDLQRPRKQRKRVSQMKERDIII